MQPPASQASMRRPTATSTTSLASTGDPSRAFSMEGKNRERERRERRERESGEKRGERNGERNGEREKAGENREKNRSKKRGKTKRIKRGEALSRLR